LPRRLADMPAISPLPPRSEDADDAVMAAKQRARAAATACDGAPGDAPRAMVASALLALARRRRLSVYMLAFFAMLVLSSVLDVRRATVRRSVASKLQLVAPPPVIDHAEVGEPGVSGLVGDVEAVGAGLLGGLRGPAVVVHTGPLDGGGRVRGGGRGRGADGGGGGGGGSVGGSGGIGGDVGASRAGEVAEKLGLRPGETGVRAALDGSHGFEDGGGVEAVAGAGAAATAGAAVGAPRADPADPAISAQELKDEVDQLIAHVEKETAKGALAGEDGAGYAPPAGAAGASIVANGSVSVQVGVAGEGAKVVHHLADPWRAAGGDGRDGVADGGGRAAGQAVVPNATTVMLGHGHASNAMRPDAGIGAGAVASVNETATAVPEMRRSAEELFLGGQKRLEEIIKSEAENVHVDENDLRIVQALALQATRGDCEQRSASEGGSLFKSDAEAASQVDVERTDQLYGAWCIFMGTYKSDAMRDFVTKLRMLEATVDTARYHATEGAADGKEQYSESAPGDAAEVAANASLPTAPPFDPLAADLTDVMDAETQSSISGKLHFLRTHLQENELRYIAALSLQATFGSCGPYGKELGSGKKPKTVNGVPVGSNGEELRVLTEPLTGQTATRRDGALWGAWCVLVGKPRNSASNELVDRTALLLEQLAKTQAAHGIPTDSGTLAPAARFTDAGEEDSHAHQLAEQLIP
jgi:hypothetical protein